MSFTYEYYKVCADYIRERAPFEPEIGLILGTGLGPFASQIENPVSIPYRDIPNFLVSTAPGHAGKLIFGTISGKKVVCMAGRFHSYEGYSFEQLSIPVRVLKLLGIRKLILTNAAGAVNESYHPGDIMILNDHLKLTGDSPMKGPNIPEFGDRFFDISRMYTPELRKIAKECAKDTGLHIHEGVYMFFTGPQFETPAEIRAARLLGADAVGMSTVTESLTAAHCGLPVLAMSVITNMAAGITKDALCQEEVEKVGDMVATNFSEYMKKIVQSI